ncbi:cupin domain-containing protein [Paraburkholderia sp. DHOC27]|uniref:cupin domain-containing protein n=1 Tax=Paraburkholderia sp. DHOC27 TaxID=2303330 RepID=UPI000E3C90D3|nr:cupin domain-containing protein [Paraburkholderia sp. DHOC27]RFU44627.1 cupin domain-containing protein [Paraburkholderia sp. DHOC27]
MIEPIDFHAIADAVPHGYMNQVLSTANDHDIHISVMDAPYFWHLHPDSDETFITLEGILIIDFHEGPVELRPGQMLTVPAGMPHRTRPAGARTVNLTVERRDATTVRCNERIVQA